MADGFAFADQLKSEFRGRGAAVSGMQATPTSELMHRAEMGEDPRANVSEEAFRENYRARQNASGQAAPSRPPRPRSSGPRPGMQNGANPSDPARHKPVSGEPDGGPSREQRAEIERTDGHGREKRTGIPASGGDRGEEEDQAEQREHPDAGPHEAGEGEGENLPRYDPSDSMPGRGGLFGLVQSASSALTSTWRTAVRRMRILVQSFVVSMRTVSSLMETILPMMPPMVVISSPT